MDNQTVKAKEKRVYSKQVRKAKNKRRKEKLKSRRKGLHTATEDVAMNHGEYKEDEEDNDSDKNGTDVPPFFSTDSRPAVLPLAPLPAPPYSAATRASFPLPPACTSPASAINGPNSVRSGYGNPRRNGSDDDRSLYGRSTDGSGYDNRAEGGDSCAEGFTSSNREPVRSRDAGGYGESPLLFPAFTPLAATASTFKSTFYPDSENLAATAGTSQPETEAFECSAFAMDGPNTARSSYGDPRRNGSDDYRCFHLSPVSPSAVRFPSVSHISSLPQVVSAPPPAIYPTAVVEREKKGF